jgi:hypothetical protein
LLIKSGAKVNSLNKRGLTPLDLAMANPDAFLREHGFKFSQELR